MGTELAPGAPLTPDAIRPGLATLWLGRELVCLERTDSTMRVAARARGARRRRTAPP